jgi:hypothetical protein
LETGATHEPRIFSGSAWAVPDKAKLAKDIPTRPANAYVAVRIEFPP